MDEEERNDAEGSAVEGRVEEENEESTREEEVVEDEEPERVLPPLLEVDLDKLGLKD